MAVQLESARSGLQKIVFDLLERAPQSEGLLLAWPMVCGAAVSAKTQILRCESGVLCVEVPDRGWRGQLQGFAGQYVGALNRLLPQKIERIEFVLANGEVERRPRAKRASAGKQGE
jgi:Dna[CI] antecedent, DciA